jgi:ribosomal protein S14
MPRPLCLTPKDPRVCVECGKNYMPNAYSQKWCNDCRPKHEPRICVGCGRHSSRLENGKCSFCLQSERKLIVQQRLEEKKSSKRCRECGRPIVAKYGLIQLLKLRLCRTCFDAMNTKPECLKCGSMKNVRLSQQETPEPNMVVWFCRKCDFVFKTEVVT